jgi:hypothetical protein
MKKLILLLSAAILATACFSQTPEKMSYQAVIRDGSGTLITEETVGMKISILSGTISGAIVYTETHTPTTDINGLVSIEVGSGNVVSGSFSGIDWSDNLYFIKTETDPDGGTTYTVTGTNQLLSVPYALHAKTADNVNNETQSLSEVTAINNSAFSQLKDVTDPTDPQDAVTKSYVDALEERLEALEPKIIGQTYAGGIVFWVDPINSAHGLVVTSPNVGNVKWHNGDYVTTGATDSTIGTGAGNTQTIIDVQGDGSYAAQLCDELTLNGYDDWYLPSKHDLQTMYENVGQGSVLGNIANFGGSGVSYWSSTEATNDHAWYMYFPTGVQYQGAKANPMYIRAVRAF